MPIALPSFGRFFGRVVFEKRHRGEDRGGKREHGEEKNSEFKDFFHFFAPKVEKFAVICYNDDVIIKYTVIIAYISCVCKFFRRFFERIFIFYEGTKEEEYRSET